MKRSGILNSSLARPFLTITHFAHITNYLYSLSNFTNSLVDILYAGIIRGTIEGYDKKSRLSLANLKGIRDNQALNIEDQGYSWGFSRFQELNDLYLTKIKSIDNNVDLDKIEIMSSSYHSSRSDIFLKIPGIESFAVDMMIRDNLRRGRKKNNINGEINFSNKIKAAGSALAATIAIEIFQVGIFLGKSLGKFGNVLFYTEEEQKSQIRKWSEKLGLLAVQGTLGAYFLFRTLAKIGIDIMQVITTGIIGFIDGFFVNMSIEQEELMFCSLNFYQESSFREIYQYIRDDIKESFKIAYDNAYKDMSEKSKKSITEMIESNPMNILKVRKLQQNQLSRCTLNDLPIESWYNGEKRNFYDEVITKIEAGIDASKALSCNLSYRISCNMGYHLGNFLFGRSTVDFADRELARY